MSVELKKEAAKAEMGRSSPLDSFGATASETTIHRIKLVHMTRETCVAHVHTTTLYLVHTMLCPVHPLRHASAHTHTHTHVSAAAMSASHQSPRLHAIELPHLTSLWPGEAAESKKTTVKRRA